MGRPKIGLALGSGGARGLAHIGVLKVLQKAGIPIDYIAGSSMGSIIGVLYSIGSDFAMLEKLAIHLKRKHWIDLTVPKLGFVVGDKIKELIKLLTHRKNLEDLPIPTAVVATDLIKEERIVFTEGPIQEAVRASISIPGVFEPVRLGDRILVDGGVIDRVPVSVVKDMGAEIIIAVDVISHVNKVKIENIFDVISHSFAIMERKILSQQTLNVDYLIHPDVSDVSPIDFKKVELCINRGELEAQKVIHEIKKLI